MTTKGRSARKPQQRQKRRSSPDRDPHPDQIGNRGPRPGALRPDDLNSVIGWVLSRSVQMLVDVALCQRLQIAQWRTERARWRKRSRSDKDAALVRALAGEPGADWREPTDFDVKDVRKTVGRVAAVGRSPYETMVGEVEKMVRARLNSVPSAGDLRGRLSGAELAQAVNEAETRLRGHADGIRRGFGDLARTEMLVNAVEGWSGILRAIHPKMGSKKLDALVARNLQMGNESVVRSLRKRAK